MSPCSRCGHTVPNVECHVCWEEPDEGPDCFSRAKDAALDDEMSFEFARPAEGVAPPLRDTVPPRPFNGL